MSGLPKEIYVVVAENDMPGDSSTKPIAFESSLYDKQSADSFAKRLNGRYGRTAVYKAVIEYEVMLESNKDK